MGLLWRFWSQHGLRDLVGQLSGDGRLRRRSPASQACPAYSCLGSLP